MTYYNSISSGYDGLHGEEQRKKLELVKSLLKDKKIEISKETKLLDVGCGTGISSDFDCDVTGIDPSEDLIRIAKKKFPDKKFIVGKAEELPFSDKEFDIVISLTAVQNFDDIKKGLSEIRRVVKDDGIVIISILKKSDKVSQFECVIEMFEQDGMKIENIEEEKDYVYFIK
ncbi:class I SAM-dependent methyltransferase [Nanoarchaeota archaeon]